MSDTVTLVFAEMRCCTTATAARAARAAPAARCRPSTRGLPPRANPRGRRSFTALVTAVRLTFPSHERCSAEGWSRTRRPCRTSPCGVRHDVATDGGVSTRMQLRGGEERPPRDAFSRCTVRISCVCVLLSLRQAVGSDCGRTVRRTLVSATSDASRGCAAVSPAGGRFDRTDIDRSPLPPVCHRVHPHGRLAAEFG